jgi:hypothetical protein
MHVNSATAADNPGTEFLHPECGFIRHPGDRPISVRRLPFWRRWRHTGNRQTGIGIVFEHPAYLRPGSPIEITIPLRGEAQHFEGCVVLVREISIGYEIGLRLLDPDQGTRIRIVEQICYMESYLYSRMDSGHALTPNRAANEWIQQHAAMFPSS